MAQYRIKEVAKPHEGSLFYPQHRFLFMWFYYTEGNRQVFFNTYDGARHYLENITGEIEIIHPHKG